MTLSDELKKAIWAALPAESSCLYPPILAKLRAIPDAHIVTVRDVYGMDDPVIPRGYERQEFRTVFPGDTYLSHYENDGAARARYSEDAFNVIGPRIILRRKKVVRKQWVFTETEEFRIASPGEWITLSNGEVADPYRVQGITQYPSRILRREEREIEVEV